jgi:hypothetical protein
VCLDRPVDIAMDTVGANLFQNSVASQHRADARLQPGQAQGNPSIVGKHENLAQLGGPLGIYEVDAFAVENDAGQVDVRMYDGAGAVLERIRGTEE